MVTAIRLEIRLGRSSVTPDLATAIVTLPRLHPHPLAALTVHPLAVPPVAVAEAEVQAVEVVV